MRSLKISHEFRSINIKKSQSINFNHFFKNNTQTYHSDFNGGLIGFISYDHAAQQQVYIREKKQPSLFLGVYRSYLKLTSQGWTF